MRSELQRQTSRLNGAKSRGPRTPQGKRNSAANAARSTGPLTAEGKERSSLNALRHGLIAQSPQFFRLISTLSPALAEHKNQKFPNEPNPASYSKHDTR